MTNLDALDEFISHMLNEQGLVLSKIGQTKTTWWTGTGRIQEISLNQTRGDTIAEYYSEPKYLQVKCSWTQNAGLQEKLEGEENNVLIKDWKCIVIYEI